MQKFNLSVARIVIFFFGDSDRHENNGAKVAPAIVNRVWSAETINCTVLSDSNAPAPKGSVPHARDLDHCQAGYCWLSPDECVAMGIDINDNWLNLEKLITERKLAREQAEETPVAPEGLVTKHPATPDEAVSSAHGFTEGSDVPFPESQTTTPPPAAIAGERPAAPDQLDPGD